MILRTFRRGLDSFQLFPARVEFRDTFLCRFQLIREPVDLRGVLAVKIRLDEQSFNARHFRLDRLYLRLHALQFTRLLDRQFAGFADFGAAATRAAGWFVDMMAALCRDAVAISLFLLWVVNLTNTVCANAGSIRGIPEMAISDMTFSNVTISAAPATIPILLQ